MITEEQLAFKHVLTQEAVYASVAGPERARLHRRTGEAIEALHPEGLEEHHEELAYHFDLGADARKAVDYLVLAGEKSGRAHLNAEAIDCFERALARLDAVEELSSRSGASARRRSASGSATSSSSRAGTPRRSRRTGARSSSRLRARGCGGPACTGRPP